MNLFGIDLSRIMFAKDAKVVLMPDTEICRHLGGKRIWQKSNGPEISVMLFTLA
jgi:hypothetical protein